MNDILEQMRVELGHKTVTISFDVNRSPREQIERAIESIKSLFCARHADEALHVDIESTISNALFHDYPHHDQPRRLEFEATYRRCCACPHSVSPHETDVEGCAVAPRYFGLHRISKLDDQGKPMPTRLGSIDLQPDTRARERLAAWLEADGEVRCSRQNETLGRLSARVTPAFKSWDIEVHFFPCPRCRLEHAGVMPDEALASFDQFVTDPPALRQHLETCRKFAAAPKGILLMMGGCGTGKTHLAISIMREVLSRRIGNIRFIKHRRFIADHLKSLRAVPFGQTPPASPLEQCQEAKLLVYDDLTTSLESRVSEEDVLLDLFEYRIGNQKPSIITTNLNRAELERAIGTRLFDRLRYAAFALLEFGFESNRAKFNADYLNRTAK